MHPENDAGEDVTAEYEAEKVVTKERQERWIWEIFRSILIVPGTVNPERMIQSDLKCDSF